jgi:hypothetical protein
MTPSDPPTEPADDTAAFQRFYREDESAPGHGVLYRLFIGWWRTGA